MFQPRSVVSTKFLRLALGALLAPMVFVTLGASSSAAGTVAVAVDDSFSAQADTLLEVPAPGVLANDQTQAGNPIIVTAFGTDQGTIISYKPDGSFKYMPPPGFEGEVWLRYQMKDSRGNKDGAIVRIYVDALPRNQDPVAEDDHHTTEKDTTLVVNIFDNDADPDGDSFVATRPLDGPQHGDATLNRYTGELTYAPAPGFIGTDTFRYQISDDDGAFSTTATVTIEVTEAETPEPGDPPDAGEPSDPDETPKPDERSDPDEPSDPAEVTTRAPARPATPDYTG